MNDREVQDAVTFVMGYAQEMSVDEAVIFLQDVAEILVERAIAICAEEEIVTLTLANDNENHPEIRF